MCICPAGQLRNEHSLSLVCIPRSMVQFKSKSKSKRSFKLN